VAKPYLCVAAYTGELIIVFSGGTVIREPAAYDVEAWELQRSDGFAVYCMPGGELAVFPPTGNGPAWLR
jgi:hypothetical protein